MGTNSGVFVNRRIGIFHKEPEHAKPQIHPRAAPGSPKFWPGAEDMTGRIRRFTSWLREKVRAPTDEELQAEIAEAWRRHDELESFLKAAKEARRTAKETRRKDRAAADD
jgi:hypothetical protein